jgi:hypothetical protein
MANLFSLLRGERHCRAFFTSVLVCVDHDNSLVMWTPRNLKLLTHSTTAPSMWMMGVLGPPFPVDHDQLLCLADVEGEDVFLASRTSIYAVSSSVIRPITVMSSADLMMVLESCAAKQAWVNREYRRGLSTHP